MTTSRTIRRRTLAAVGAMAATTVIGGHHPRAWAAGGTGTASELAVPGPGETLAFPAATTFRLECPAEIRLELGDGHRLSIDAEPAVRRRTRITARDGVLSLSVSGSFQTDRPIVIRIVAQRVTEIELGQGARLSAGPIGPGRLQLSLHDDASTVLERLNLSQLRIDSMDNGEVVATGRADQLELRTAGASRFDGTGLTAERASVVAGDAAEVLVRAQRSLDAAVRDAATVRYLGDPSIRRQVDDAASLERG
ncbi:MAG: DUF2807 domain-containing protein [Burkholderiaceae bacterium]